MRTITTKHLGKRLLITTRLSGISRTEVEVLEVSPSGDNLKLRNLEMGNTFWTPADEHCIVEELPRVEANADEEASFAEWRDTVGEDDQVGLLEAFCAGMQKARRIAAVDAECDRVGPTIPVPTE